MTTPTILAIALLVANTVAVTAVLILRTYYRRRAERAEQEVHLERTQKEAREKLILEASEWHGYVSKPEVEPVAYDVVPFRMDLFEEDKIPAALHAYRMMAGHAAAEGRKQRRPKG